MTKIVPTNDNLVIEAIEESTVSASGIIIPDTASKEKPMKGNVLAVGQGKLTEDGKRLPLDIKEGDVVIFSKYGGNEIKVDGKKLLIVSAVDIFAKLA